MLRVSFIILSLCALETAFWLTTATADHHGDVADHFHNRWASQIRVSPHEFENEQEDGHGPDTSQPDDAIECYSDLAQKRKNSSEAPAGPPLPNKLHNQHNRSSCRTQARESDEPPPQKPRKGKDDVTEEKHVPASADQTDQLEYGINTDWTFKRAWQHMTSNYTKFDIAVYGSAILHLLLTLGLSLWPLAMQNIPFFEQYKIQSTRKSASARDWAYVLGCVLSSQLFVQLPLILGQYAFVCYFEVALEYEFMPTMWDLAWRLFLALVIEDTWHYWMHRALHHKRIYKHIHKVHHAYTAPFSLEAELAHPIETVLLGVGFFIPLVLFTNHLAFMWAWLVVRLVETTDVHCGYDLPFNPLHLIPGYAGARHHDFHHEHFNANFASTFVWWDRLLGTDATFLQHRERSSSHQPASPTAPRESQSGTSSAQLQGGEVGRDESCEWDVVIVGAGTAGASLAAVLAREGRRVLVVERDLTEQHRIVGELLQPGGRAALQRLHLEQCIDQARIDSVEVRGYVLHAPQCDAVVVRYPKRLPQTVSEFCGIGQHNSTEPVCPNDDGWPSGRSFHNGRFVQALREEAVKAGAVLMTGSATRLLLSEDGESVCGVEYKDAASKKSAYAHLTVVSDGIWSSLRRQIAVSKEAATPEKMSTFAGVILEHPPMEAPLHHRYYGHVVLAQPSPCLIYQISSTETRVLCDVPHDRAQEGIPEYLQHHIAPQMPDSVRTIFLAAVKAGCVRSMPNQALPSVEAVKSRSVLLGDAFNMRHPLTGGGMSVALNDVSELSSALHDCDLSSSAQVKAAIQGFKARRAPHAGVINILANALYRTFTVAPSAAKLPSLQLRDACLAYLSCGGACTAGPVGFLAGVAPTPSLLVLHFFMVALFGVRSVLQGRATGSDTHLPGRALQAYLLLHHAVGIIMPIVEDNRATFLVWLPMRCVIYALFPKAAPQRCLQSCCGWLILGMTAAATKFALPAVMAIAIECASSGMAMLLSAALAAPSLFLVALFALSLLFFGHATANMPISNLGTNSGAGFNTRVWGYDASRGEFSLFCIACFCAPSLCLLPSLPLPAVVSVLCFIMLFGLWYRYGMHASHPGVCRPHRIMRQPSWPKRTWTFKGSWHCSVAEESHRQTEAAVANGEKMTGEVAGRQTWHSFSEGGETPVFEFSPDQNPNPQDAVWRSQQVKAWKSKGGHIPDGEWEVHGALDHLRKALAWFEILQCDDGHWAGDYGGPHFLLPGLVVVWYITGQRNDILSVDQCGAIAHYIRVHQQADGGWGMHIESPSTMFGTCLSYIALRLLGSPADDGGMISARSFIHAHGGALYTASWAKFYMCVLGVMEWSGHQVIPAEAWLLPQWFPFHPARLWCHCRMVYLPMCYLYGVKFVYPLAESDPLIRDLRKELYTEEYSTIRWHGTSRLVADIDNYSPIHPVMQGMHTVLELWESYGGSVLKWLRKRGVDYALEYMAAEDAQTNHICIGPVNKVLNMLSLYHASSNSTDTDSFRKHVLRIADYLWVSEDGMKMQGYNGSQGWDVSFTLQALAEASLVEDFPQMCCKAFSYLERTQILSTETSQCTPAAAFEAPTMRLKYHRHVSKGGWPFSTAAHGWPISDCTAEGLKAVLLLRSEECIVGRCDTISDERLFDALNVLLTLQNTDGGWATYENNRGYRWFEMLNPSEVFGDIMIDYSYVECSMASLSAIYAFHCTYPLHRTKEVTAAINAGRSFIKSIQRPDGSWYGSWGCCFTYGTWFGVEGLALSGEEPASDALQRACSFLLSKQNENGGWGEDFTSCYDKAYAPQGMARWGNSGSGVVNTAWALLALMAAQSPDTQAVSRGIKYLMEQQLPNGDWPQEGIAGVFNRACGISYTNYRNIFPMWALARYSKHYAAKE